MSNIKTKNLENIFQTILSKIFVKPSNNTKWLAHIELTEIIQICVFPLIFSTQLSSFVT